MGGKNQNVRCQNVQSVLSFSMYTPALHSYLAILFFPLSTHYDKEREPGHGTERPRRRQGLSTLPRGISAMVSESASEQYFITDLCHSYSPVHLPLTHLWLMQECVLICNVLEA